MALLTKTAILEADDREYEEVFVEQWQGTVRLSSMTASERDRFEASMLPEKGKDQAAKMQNFRARFLAACIVDDDSKPLFSPVEVKQLGEKSANVLSMLFDHARKLNGFTTEDVSELEKN